MLKKRIITAIILIPITLGILFYLPSASFAFLTAFVALAAAWEWSSLMGIKHTAGRWLYVALMACTFVGGLFMQGRMILYAALAWWLIAACLVFLYPRSSGWWKKGVVWRGAMGILVLLPCWWTLNYIRAQANGTYVLLYVFILIWGADSVAYFVGRKWGQRKLAPQVSPGKSVEGMVGAIIYAILIAILACLVCTMPLNIWPFGVLLSVLTVLFSILGDLFESMLKRTAQVKDSGSLLPGHGGLLDRIDSLTAAAPIFACGAWWLGAYLT